MEKRLILPTVLSIILLAVAVFLSFLPVSGNVERDEDSKSIEEFRGQTFDYVVTVCDSAKETCPFFPGKKVIHHSFEDPSQFEGSEEQILENVRKVRNEIKEWIKKTFTN